MTTLELEIVSESDVPEYEVYEPTPQDRFEALKFHATKLLGVEGKPYGLHDETIHELLWAMAHNKIEFMVGPECWPVYDKTDMH